MKNKCLYNLNAWEQNANRKQQSNLNWAKVCFRAMKLLHNHSNLWNTALCWRPNFGFFYLFQNGHCSTENAVGLSEIWCLFHMFEQTTEWLLGTQEPDSSAISCLYQNYLQRDGEMGEKLWAGNKEKSGKLVVPKNKGAVLQNFRNRCKHCEKFGDYVWYFCFLKMKLIQKHLIQLAYDDEMYITDERGIFLCNNRILKANTAVGGK